MNHLREDNRIVHGMWVGAPLSRLELLTLRSFTHFGHEFHLWLYDDLSVPVPVGVRLRDANEIIPRDKVFKKADYDPETGVGKNSYGAPFSDLFRYRLLHEHGGIWADMDVTCLQPFNFDEEFVFRTHRVGVVGNIMKCPKNSRLMRDTYEETAAIANERCAWLAPNRILAKNVERLGLQHYVKSDICNPDSWMNFIRPMIERLTPIPENWYAIHWINEFWRVLSVDGGRYRGQKIVDCAPDKNNPPEGGTLHELYRKYRLIDPWQTSQETNAVRSPTGGSTSPNPTLTNGQANQLETAFSGHLNVLIPSMVRGGGEWIVLDTREALRKAAGISQNLFLLHHSGPTQYPYRSEAGATVVHVTGDSDESRMRLVANHVLQSPVPLLYTHLIRTHYLQYLWSLGVNTVPVVHNQRPGWLDPPSSYNRPRVPFVAAVSEAVAAQLRQAGCERPIVTIRHEVQRRFKPEDLARYRREVRDRHGVRDEVLLIGMVGQFKAQKAYTRAVRVLHAVQGLCRAKLLILGGWDHGYGSGRAAYEAACRQAVELGVVADVITPGDVYPVEPYFAAFDVFLNTSVFEGLSVAMLEAIQAGCPVVTADAGGNREVLPPASVLVNDPTDIPAYVEGICKVVKQRDRVLPAAPSEPSLVPRLWSSLATYGVSATGANQIGTPNGTLFVTNDLHIGGPQRSIVNLLCRLPAKHKTFLGVLGGISANSFQAALEGANVPVLRADTVVGSLARAERIVQWADQLNVRSICFWNVHPEIKLALAKILWLRNLRIIDVSPGPMLFEELASASDFQRRICLNSEQYFRRLDSFVALYADGAPPAELSVDRNKVAIIPLGVPTPPRFIPLPHARVMLPRRCDPQFAIGTCSRIVPEKHIEFLIEMMAGLSTRLPEASLTIVGGPDARSVDYMNAMIASTKQAGLDKAFFVGRHEDVGPFLSQFKVFVMVGDRQGCPNASLEAMAMKVPVVTNRSGGTHEQVEDGVNGFLINDASEMAQRVELLLTDDRLHRKFAEAGRRVVSERFSMERMVSRYQKLLEGGFPLYLNGLRGKKRGPEWEESSFDSEQIELVAAD
jgi:glycosyltransferase involved in cell wall biosynthesis